MCYLGAEGLFFFIISQFVFLVTINHAKWIQCFKQPILPGHDLDAVQDSFVSQGICLGTLAHLTSVASRHVVYAWIIIKVGTVGVQLPSGTVAVKFEEPKVCCDLHDRSSVLEGPIGRR